MKNKINLTKINSILCYISAVFFIIVGIAAMPASIPCAVLGIAMIIFKVKQNKVIKVEKEQLAKLIETTTEPDFVKFAEDKAYKDELLEQIKSLTDEKEQALAAAEKEKDRIQKEIDSLNEVYEKKKQEKIDENKAVIEPLQEKVISLTATVEKLEKQQKTAQNKLNKSSEILRAMLHSLDNFFEWVPPTEFCKNREYLLESLDELSPTVTLNLHSMDIKDLRKAYRKNDKDIETLLSSYLSRYNTKTNRSIYQLMVISLRAELQNILINLKYEKLDTAIEKIKETTAKYLTIASEGNQNIVGTMTKFIGQIEYLFINAAKIEYNYYVKKEKAKQEQMAIREQMRIEAQERKALEAEQKKIEAEENKYEAEIEKLKAQLESVAEAERTKLNAKITELQAQLSDVIIKKDEIVKLQNGKAGNIYVISNLGSFGEDVFKIGMTRRLDPQERVNELGSASVPFKFDVHSFIFSDNAVELENRLHTMLNEKRVNKVNLRKEFFKVSIDELQQLVEEVDPTAEFTKTMAAEEYRQSLSTDKVYTSDISSDYDEDEEEDE